MKRIYQYLRIDWSNRKQARVALMAAMLVAAYVGLFMEQTYAQAPQSELRSGAQKNPGSEAGSEAAGAGEATPAQGSETTADEPAPSETISFLALFNAGGWAMWPLLLSSIVALMVIMERLYYYTVTKVLARTFQQDLRDGLQLDGMAGVNAVLESNKAYAIAGILKEGMGVSHNEPELFSRGVEREAGGLMVRAERGLAVLAAVSTIAPLIGFLGTVSGMISAFDAIATADTVNAKVVAGGIKEALITTATGLIVAIPAMAFFQYFTTRVNGWASEIEQAANAIYKELLRIKGGSGSGNSRVRETAGNGVAVS